MTYLDKGAYSINVLVSSLVSQYNKHKQPIYKKIVSYPIKFEFVIFKKLYAAHRI